MSEGPVGGGEASRPSQAEIAGRTPDSSAGVRQERRGRLSRLLRSRRVAAVTAAATVGIGVPLAVLNGGSSPSTGKDTGQPVGIEKQVHQPKTLDSELRALGLDPSKNRLVIGEAQRKNVADSSVQALADSPFTNLALPDGGTINDLIASGLARTNFISAVEESDNQGNYTLTTDITPGNPDQAQRVDPPISIISSFLPAMAESSGDANKGVISIVGVTVDSDGKLVYSAPSLDKKVFSDASAQAFGESLHTGLKMQPIVPDLGEVDFGDPDGNGDSLSVSLNGQVIWRHTGGYALDVASLVPRGGGNTPAVGDAELAYAIISSPHAIKPELSESLPPETTEKLDPVIQYRNTGMADGVVPVPAPNGAVTPSWALASPDFSAMYAQASTSSEQS